MVSNQVRGFVNTTVQLLLDTLVEIQEIAYSSDAQRTPRSVLRLHNLTWYHGMLCRSVIGFSLNQMTTRKFYGNYFHNITVVIERHLRTQSTQGACFWRAAWKVYANFRVPHPPAFTKRYTNPPDFSWTPRVTPE